MGAVSPSYTWIENTSCLTIIQVYREHQVRYTTWELSPIIHYREHQERYTTQELFRHIKENTRRGIQHRSCSDTLKRTPGEVYNMGAVSPSYKCIENTRRGIQHRSCSDTLKRTPGEVYNTGAVPTH